MAKFWIVDICLTVEAANAEDARLAAEWVAEIGTVNTDEAISWEISGVPAAADDDTLRTPD